MKILVETSARHIHLSESDFKILFGDNYKLTEKRSLSQPGQFVSYERLKIIGPRNHINNVVILGPLRAETQVEISITDSIKLGIDAPIRESGNLVNTPGCIISGPNGNLEIKTGVIIAKRHIHLSDKEANEFMLKDQQTVAVKINSLERSVIFDNVIVRVNKNFSAAMHIDTDEANAAGISSAVYGEIIK